MPIDIDDLLHRSITCVCCKGNRTVPRGEWINHAEVCRLAEQAQLLATSDDEGNRREARKLKQQSDERRGKGYHADPVTGEPLEKRDDGTFRPCPREAVCPHCHGTGKAIVQLNPLEVRAVLIEQQRAIRELRDQVAALQGTR